MKFKKVIFFSMLGMFFLISGCQDEDLKKDYSGFSDIVSERIKVRQEKSVDLTKSISEKKKIAPKQITTNDTETLKPDVISKEEKLSSIVLYEQEVEIVNSKSQVVMAEGIAYINKKGEIIKIKIFK